MATANYEMDNGFGAPANGDVGYVGYDDPGISMGDLLRNLLSITRRNLWLIIAIIVAFVFGAAVITITMTPKYTARASIEISTQAEKVLGDQFDQSNPQVEAWDTDRFLNTQVSILKSRALAKRVADKLDLYNDPKFFLAMQIDQDSFESNTALRNGVLNSLIENMNIRLASESSLAEIEFTSTNSSLSAQIANTYAQEFIQANLQRKFDSSSYAREFVSKQLNDARARLEASEQQLNVYARNASLIRTRDPSSSENSTSNSITTSSLLQLNQSANEAKAARVAAEARWNAERAQPLLSSPAALSSPVVQSLQNRRSELQAQLQDAQGRYLSDHPTVQRLSTELQNLDAQLTKAATQARDSVRANLVAAQTAEKNLKGQVSQLENATLQEQDRSVRYNTFAREADTNRSIYEGLLQRYRELNASAGITASNVSIIDVANPPVFPSSPNPLLNVLVASILGAITAAGVVFLKDQLDDRIRIPEEVEEKVGINLLGVIPATDSDDPVEELRDPKSAIAESYSALRSSLLYATREGLPGLILVTSAQPSEGKSTTSYAIARSLSLIGKRVLLVDADLRRPSVHRIVGIPNKTGISNVLVGELSASEVIVQGETPNLSILPCGPLPPSPAELLLSSRLYSLFDELRQKYDCIIIDSAPVLGLADSPSLSALADGVLLIVESNRGRGGQLKAAVRRLRQMKPVILGVVLTKFNPEQSGNAYSTYYQYNYYTYNSGSSE